MGGDRLFVVQVVMMLEDQWWPEDRSGPPLRFERNYFVESTLFAAADAEEAYRIALGWLPGLDHTYSTYP